MGSSSSSPAAPQLREVMRLAEGGMGTVSLVLRSEGSFSRLMAVKRLRPDLREDADAREMFLKEARLSGLVRHPNLVAAIDVGDDDGGPLMVMDFVEGVSVADVLSALRRQQLQLPAPLAFEIVRQTACGLGALHEMRAPDGQSLQLVHRDVSPQNIMVGYDGVVRLTDLGVAKVLDETSRTQAGLVKGKRGYLAPEQLRFETVDKRADLFALGVVLFELLTGRRLYPEGPVQILNDSPPDIGDERDDLPDELVELLFELLAKDPAQRPASADEVAARLRTIIDDYPLHEGPVDLGAFMAESFADRRARQQEDIARAIKATEVGSSEAPVRPRSRRLVWLGVPIAAGGLLMAGLYLGSATPSAPQVTDAARPPGPASAVSRPAAAREAAKVVPAAEPPPSATVAPRPRPARARRTGKRPAAPDKPQRGPNGRLWKTWP